MLFCSLAIVFAATVFKNLVSLHSPLNLSFSFKMSGELGAAFEAPNFDALTEEIVSGVEARNRYCKDLKHLVNLGFQQYSSCKRDQAFIYSFGNKICGFAYLSVTTTTATSTEVYVDLQWTDPDLRCNLFGTSIVERIKTFFPLACINLWATVEALPFWLKVGFKTTNEIFNQS